MRTHSSSEADALPAGSPLAEYLTVSHLAERRGTTPEQIRAQIDKGRIPAVRVGRRAIRIPTEETQRALDALSPGWRTRTPAR